MKTIMQIITKLIIMMFLYAPLTASAQSNSGTVSNCIAYREISRDHANFRQRFPYHFQCVAQKEYPDGSRLILVSEPSPDVTELELNAVFGNTEFSSSILMHKLGYDGYIKDVAFVVKNADENKINNIIASLHKILYASDYKHEKVTLNLSEGKSRKYFSHDLNSQITLAELEKNFIQPSELQTQFIGTAGRKVTIPQLLAETSSGIFYNDDPEHGIVAWVIDKGQSLNSQKENIRKFVLDTDIIFGGFSNGNKLIVLGQERVCPVEEMPPLCVETILLLPACYDQLEQSLDSNDLLAGRIQEDKYDWIPTYLNSTLENTEFGNLLTLTDILLKDWSESGNLYELDFKYQRPSRYPFNSSLTKTIYGGCDLMSDNAILYNWNTSDVLSTYLTPGGGMKYYSVNGTGALTVSYFKDAEGKNRAGNNLDNIATNYFAEINNSDIARVVQYYSLYSMFKSSNIRVTKIADKKNAASFILLPAVTKLLTNIRDASDETLSQFAKGVSTDFVCFGMGFNDGIEKGINKRLDEELEKSLKMSGLTINTVDKSSYEQAKKYILTRLQHHVDSVLQLAYDRAYEEIVYTRSQLKNMKKLEFDATCKILAYPRQCTQQDAMAIPSSKLIKTHLQNATFLTQKNMYRHFGVNLKEVRDNYTTQLENESSNWIKTPTIVRTFFDQFFVGGHNLGIDNQIEKTLSSTSRRSHVVNINTIRELRQIIPSVSRTHRGL